MNQKYRDILEKCPYGLSRLASLNGDTLEYITGKELIGILLLAKQHGYGSGYKDIWSRYPVVKVKLDEDVSAQPDCYVPYAAEHRMEMPLRNFLTDKRFEINADSTETPTRISHRSEANSPFTDPST